MCIHIRPGILSGSSGLRCAITCAEGPSQAAHCSRACAVKWLDAVSWTALVATGVKWLTAPEWRLTESRFMLDWGVKWLTAPCGVHGAVLGTGELGTLDRRLLPPLSTWNAQEQFSVKRTAHPCRMHLQPETHNMVRTEPAAAAAAVC